MFQHRVDRDQRPSSKRGMPESSLTRQHVIENTLRSKLKTSDRNKDLDNSTRADYDSK